MLGQLESGGHAVVADMEAGAGTLTRMAAGSLDWALLVTEPSAKSIEVSRRAAQIIRERQIAPVMVIANRVRGAADVELIRTGVGVDDVFTVPEDPDVARADREGAAVLDLAPDSPAVQAALALSRRLSAA